MKRALVLFLAMMMLLSLAACNLLQGNPTEPTESPVPETKVPKPYTLAEMEALTVAKPGMTEDELRQVCVDYMKAQTNIVWTPSKDFSYKSQSKYVKLVPETLYGGMPYITVCQGSLYNFMHFYDERNGMLDVEKFESLEQDWTKVIANQCSGSTYWAWARVCNSITFKYCNNILPVNGYIFPEVIAEKLEGLAEYYPSGAGIENITSTKYEICPEIGDQGMYELYAQMKPADGLMHYDGWTTKKVEVTDEQGNVTTQTVPDKLSAAGHVIMCVDVHVVRNDDGSVNGKKSYAIIRDQTLSYDDVKTHYVELENGEMCKVYPNWDAKFSFDTLFSTGYLPFTMPEFLGASTDVPECYQYALSQPDFEERAEVEVATLELKDIKKNQSVTLGDSTTVDELTRIGLESNYPMSYNTVTVKSPAGEILYEGHVYTCTMNAYKVNKALDDYILDYDKLCELADGNNTVEISARVSTGEVLVAYSGKLAG